MSSIEYYLRKAARNGSVRSGMVLGIRMVLAALRELGEELPPNRNRSLIAIVETDRCLPDVVELVANCRLGNRTLKFKDFGKMAVTLVKHATKKAVRVSAFEISALEACRNQNAEEREKALVNIYTSLPENLLFRCRQGTVDIPSEDIPGFKDRRVPCELCGEGIAFSRHVHRDGQVICRSCAGDVFLCPVEISFAKSGEASPVDITSIR